MSKRKRQPALVIGLAAFLGATATLAAPRPPAKYQSGVFPTSSELCSDMKSRHVLNPGAPVGCDRLRVVRFDYIGFDGRPHEDGEIMVMDAVADQVLGIFASLREMRFPIERARLMNHYDGDDDRSMADNNTSAFNHRTVAGTRSVSLHAYGLAIDLNPKQNPYVERDSRGAILAVSPPSGRNYLNRIKDRPAALAGMAEAAIDAFADHGFLIWGGHWRVRDYQHFQVGRKLAGRLARSSPDQARALFKEHVQAYLACRQGASGKGSSDRSSCIVGNDQ